MFGSALWQQAERTAQQTPEARNRYVDLLRALSITVVVLGHWLMAGPWTSPEGAELAHLLDIQPLARWLTWLFQVMPVFFFVGGFSNGTSWDSAQARGEGYATWLEARMRRLLGPAVPLVLLWMVLGLVGSALGVPAEMIRVGSQVALVPTWFLAIYLLIVMCVPFARAAWRRFSLASVVVPMVGAAGIDLVFFSSESWQALGWLNYLLIWGAVHQLGFAWQQGLLAGAGRTLMMLVFGASVLVVLTQFGPYPTSLVGVPSEVLSNTTPPKWPLLALALAQIGLLLTLEAVARKWLSRGAVWTGTVLVNGLIMTLFLWHSTVMMLLVGVLFALAPDLLSSTPGSGAWWALRPLWILIYALATLPFLLVFMRLEARISNAPAPLVPLWRLLPGAAMLCTGLALLAGGGVTGDGPLGIAWLACLLPVAGSVLAGFGPHRFVRARSEPGP